MLDVKKCVKMRDDFFPELEQCISLSVQSVNNNRPGYDYLLSRKKDIPKELYAWYLRRLLQMGTSNVPIDLRLTMFEGVDQNDIMYPEELERLNNEFEYPVTAYRGTNPFENEPGLSWSIVRACTDEFYDGRLYEAQIPREAVLLFIDKDAPEAEIIAHVTENYRIIEGN